MSNLIDPWIAVLVVGGVCLVQQYVIHKSEKALDAAARIMVEVAHGLTKAEVNGNEITFKRKVVK